MERGLGDLMQRMYSIYFPPRAGLLTGVPELLLLPDEEDPELLLDGL
jgi:hypothetical protein